MSEHTVDRDQVVAVFRHVFARNLPHNAALGLDIIALEDGRAQIRLPYRDDLVGNPETGVLHGGAITSLVDATCGAAVFMRVLRPVNMATLDLRIDYLKPAAPGAAVIADAECYKLTRSIAFVRASAFHDDPADPIASASGTFVFSRSHRRAPDAPSGPARETA